MLLATSPLAAAIDLLHDESAKTATVEPDRERQLRDARRRLEEAGRLHEEGDYRGATIRSEGALEILERLLGPDDREVVAALRSLAASVDAAGGYARAEALHRRALGLARRHFAEGHPVVAEIEDGLARNAFARREFAEAHDLAQRALAARERAFGEDHVLVASSLGTLAEIYLEQREYSKAEELSNLALETAGRTYGPDTLAYQRFATRVADVQVRRGNFERAEALLDHSLAVREKEAGSESVEVGDSLSSLAYLHLQKRDNLKALEIAGRALRVQENVLGPDHPTLTDILNTLGLLSFRRRDFGAAEAHFLRARAINERVFGPDHISLARLFNNLGLVYWRQGDDPKAGAHYRRALELMERTFGEDNPNVVPSLVNLGIITKETGDYARAESYYLRALAIMEKAHGASHPQLVVPLESLGILYRDRGDPALAEPYFLRVLDITAGSRGPEHPDVARHLANLWHLYSAHGETTKALRALERRMAIEEKNLPLHLAVGSERQKLAFFEPFVSGLDEAVSFHLANQTAGPEAGELAATILLQRKGRVLDVMANSLVAFLERSDPADRAKLEALNEVTSQLATLVLNGPQKLSFADHQSEIEELSARRDELENELSRRTAGYFEPADAVTLADVKAAIPPDAVLVEFAVYHPFDPKSALENETLYGEPRYVAYVLSRERGVSWTDLGPAKDIDDSVDALRRTLRDPKRRDVAAAARALDAKIMAPVRALSGDPARLLVSPDGQLHLIPFEALVDEEGRYLIERYPITYLSSGRDLLRMQVQRPSRGRPLVVADPLFGEPDVTRLAGRNERARAKTATAQRGITTGEELSHVYFAPLTGTAHEARSIKALFPEAAVWTRSEATEASLKAVEAPSILHIATHGFFLGESAESAGDEQTRAIQASVDIENPLLRSGLALSGANLNETGAYDDGILTALEASSLNLWGTKLVTLSACDTGVGEVRNGEGVYGLRRAFFLAGTETLVMSLWPVSDSVTRRMMTAYYSGLKAGLGRGDALRQAQLEMLAQKGREHPFYWASFIQSGDWTPLDGRR